MACRPRISSIRYQWTYDVFLNFRGEDTRYGFTGNLYKALNQRGVRTFFDDKEIGIGVEITPTLLEAIKESRIAIVVFSKEYASSTFCLNELVQIHQCIKGNGHLVWPIFYDVEPSEVRHQRGKYGQALVAHEQYSRADEEKMKSWKHALHEVANVKGSPFDPRKDYEHKLIEEIVNRIFKIIRRDLLDDDKYLVGLDSRMKKINYLLQIGSNDEVIMIGVYGNGGTGKTTATRAVYNAIADNFDHLCFLGDIKGGSEKHGLEKQQARMLSKILGQKIEIEDIDEGVELIKRTLRDKKILLILDNVDERMQLQKLAGACEWFGFGSRIIITTRDLHLLKSHGVERRYEMEGLNHEESLELISWNAFGKMQVDDPRYAEVVNEVINYASGLPLALEILGSDLYGKNVSEWKSMLGGCKRIPHGKIQQILEVSYKGLQQLEKEVFLDIACFYKGSELEYVKKMVAIAHDFDPDYHIGVLVDKCLIKISRFNRIEMHDMVQDMGRDTVRLQSPTDPGKRSRLWSNEDILRVLERNEGTDEVIIIIQFERSKCIEVKWNGRAFKSMNNLKILILDNTKFSQGPKYLPNSLAVLRWRGYPSSSWPRGFRPKDLVDFSVRDSCFNSTEISKITQNMKVSVLNFEGCEYISHIPDISGLSVLKELQLCDCKNLIAIDNSVGQLAKLETLNVCGCAQLMTFPSELNTPSLYDLGLERCSSLNYFPEIATREMKIEKLSLAGTGINQLPPSVENLTQLRYITLIGNDTAGKGIRSMKLPSSAFLLPKFESIYVEGYEELLMEVESITCPSIWNLQLEICNLSNESLHIYLTSFPNIRFLDLSGSDFTILPACIEHCQNLEVLELDECKHLIEVEKVPPSIQRLTAQDCVSLSSQSKNLLLRKELIASLVPIKTFAPGLADEFTEYFCVPGGSIPEWFDHCNKGPSISFWFLNYCVPSFCVCAIVQTGRNPFWFETRMVIDDKVVYVFEREEVTTGSDVDHIVIHYIWKFDISEEFEKDEWHHVTICPFSVLGYDVKECGIYVMRDEWTNMENIRFTDPSQSLDFFMGDQGCATEGDIATNNPFFPSQSEQQHTHSHTVRDIDSLRILSVQCRRIIFPITFHMDSGMVGSQLGYDFYITEQNDFYITEQDVMKFLSMQELSITIIQLFVRFCCELCSYRGIVDRFGFLCPNAIRGVGHTREDKISYVGSTIKEGNKQCWLAPIREGNHWILCAICPGSNIIHWFDSLGGKQSDDIEKLFTE